MKWAPERLAELREFAFGLNPNGPTPGVVDTQNLIIGLQDAVERIDELRAEVGALRCDLGGARDKADRTLECVFVLCAVVDIQMRTGATLPMRRVDAEAEAEQS